MAETTTTRKTYFVVFGALMLLLVLTMGASLVGLGRFEVVANLGIASAKALLVVLYFMHIRFESPLMRLFAGAGLVWLLLLLGLTLSDYLSRGWL
jgi:cytochrome c oxidase subunit 4